MTIELAAGSTSPANASGSAATHRNRIGRTDSGPAMALIARRDPSCQAASSTTTGNGHAHDQTAHGRRSAPPINDDTRPSPQATTAAAVRAVRRNRSAAGARPHRESGRRRDGHRGESAVVLPSLSRREDQTGTGSRTGPSTRATRWDLPTQPRPRTTPWPAIAPSQRGRSAPAGAQTPHVGPLHTQTCLLIGVSSQLKGYPWGCSPSSDAAPESIARLQLRPAFPGFFRPRRGRLFCGICCGAGICGL